MTCTFCSSVSTYRSTFLRHSSFEMWSTQIFNIPNRFHQHVFVLRNLLTYLLQNHKIVFGIPPKYSNAFL